MRRLREHHDVLALAALAFALALWQRPGVATSDTKIDLHVDPVGFLGDVAALWSPTGDLGHVHGGQYSGYLFPMAPFFALGRLAGLEPWLVHRLWLGALLALAAVGGARLAGALLPRGGALARVTAGLAMLLNPYVVVFANRTSITLLAYALLPWMLLAVHRGLRSPRHWWWPAALAVIVASAGGGVNVAVIGWLLLAPLGLLAYEVAAGAVARRDAVAFALRAGALVAVTSVWWAAPVLAHALHAPDFLPFTEQPGVIWGTTAASEVLRLMGYWTSYIGVGYTGRLSAYTSDSGVMLFSAPVVAASMLIPAAAAASLVWARRWGYAAFALGLVLAGALIVGAGFPDGTPLRRAALGAYFHLQPIQFLRTTYKAAPLLVLGYALLLAAAAGPAAAALGRLRPARRWRALAAVAGVGVLALSAYPLARGRAVDSQLSWRAIPPAWTHAAAGLDRELPPNTRAVVLPGQLFAWNRWGATVDPILPALTRRPVAERGVVPYADLRAVDLLWTVDGLIQQERTLPGQLPPLLSLLGAGAVVLPGDDNRSRSGAIGAAGAARQLTGVAGLTPAREYGARRTVAGEAGSLEPAARLPRVTRFDLPRPAGLVRVLPDGPRTLVDGSAGTLAGLAALGALEPGRPLDWAADRGAGALRAAAAAGADVVIGDGNRRRIIVPPRTRQETGPTLTAGAPLPPDAAVLDPHLAHGTDAQTVAEYAGGIRDVREDVLPGVTQFPEHRPFAAVDGDPATSWIAPAHSDEARHWLELSFDHPRPVPYVDLLPQGDAAGTTTAVRIGGREWRLRPGWNHLPVALPAAGTLRVEISHVELPRGRKGSPGGIAELRVPGVHARERLRPPVVLERALAGADLRRSSLTYLFERTTGATPFRRETGGGAPQLRLTRDRGDAETQLARRIAPPARRDWSADGWLTVAPGARDPALDRLAGVRGGPFTSSGRFEGRPGLRASRALDGSPASAWIAPWPAAGGAWIAWHAGRAVTVRALRLEPPRERVRQPTRVRLQADGLAGPELRVAADGRLTLPAPVRAHDFRLEILAARFPPGTDGRTRQRRAVGIAEIAGAGVRAGASRPAGAPVAARCGALTVRTGAGALTVRPHGTVADLDAGRPLRAAPCGAPLRVPAGPATLTTTSATWRPYWLRLRSAAPDPVARAAVLPGGVVDPGRFGRARVSDVRLDVRGPAQLVLAESYDPGWRATCDGRDLGAPVPAAGFANGWRLTDGCRLAAFRYGPDAPVRVAMIASGALGVLLALALLILRRPPARPHALADPGPAEADGCPRAPWRRALAAGVVAGLAAMALIALRAGPPVALATVLVVRQGIGVRALALSAAALLAVAVPAAYLVHPPRDRGGYAFTYASDVIAGHWLAIAALVLLTLALARIALSTARGRSDARAPAPAAAARRRWRP
jgi:arabinofuranan 3-O-arabinosyltransferase